MGWYNASWKFRIPLSIDATAKGSGPIDSSIVLPSTIDHLYANALSSGNDLRVTAADGTTLLTYDLASFDTSAKTGTIEVDNHNLKASTTNLLWLYYGNSGASDARSAFAPASAANGYVAQERPPANRTILAGIERPGALRPSTQVAKSPNEVVFVYWDVTDMLARRATTYSSSTSYEEVVSANLTVYLAAAGQSGMIDSTATRFIEHAGRFFVKTLIQAGTDAVDYQLDLTVNTSLDVTTFTGGGGTITPIRRFHAYALLKVREPDEA